MPEFEIIKDTPTAPTIIPDPINPFDNQVPQWGPESWPQNTPEIDNTNNQEPEIKDCPFCPNCPWSRLKIVIIYRK